MRGSVCACVQTAGGLSAAVAAACADDLAEDCSLVAAAPDSSASSNRFPAAQLAVGREVRMPPHPWYTVSRSMSVSPAAG